MNKGLFMDVLARTYRGEIEDLITYGTIVLVDSSGKVIYEKGDGSEYAYPRSSAKLMQALTTISMGAAEKFNFTGKEISQICASHSGEDFHIDCVRGILEKIGLDESYLQCGAHYPYKEECKLKMQKNDEEPLFIHNNCSGKHAGMLAGAVLMGADLKTYTEPSHPIQIKITEMISELCEIKKEDIKIGIDGCSVPVHAMPIRNFAYGMARFSDYDNLPENLRKPAELVINSIHENPVYASGSDRLDYYLMDKASEKIIVKSGANGYFAGCLPERKQGFAIKTYQSEAKYKNRILIGFLKKLGIINEEDYDFFDNRFDKNIYNHRKKLVGEIICEL